MYQLYARQLLFNICCCPPPHYISRAADFGYDSCVMLKRPLSVMHHNE
jgi:hypothetical protein